MTESKKSEEQANNQSSEAIQSDLPVVDTNGQDVEGFATRIAELEAQTAEYLDGWQRARAELDNYRKRVAREKGEWDDSLRSEVVLGILPAIDDLDLALLNLPTDLAKHDWVNGILLARRKLHTQLSNMGISEVDTSGHFDPVLHEAVTHEPSDGLQAGDIISVVRKGYKIGDRVIRHAMVRVAS